MAQSLPLISIIIPHLNQPEQLRRCLSSLREQTSAMYGVETIVVDNGSNALPTHICASFRRVRLEQEAVPGPGPARNKGVRVSRGSILAFIDADCIADRHWLSTIATVFEHGEAEIIGGDVRIALVDPAKPTLLEAYESIFAYRQQEYIERYGFSGTGNLAMRRSAYDDVGPFAGIELAEDRDWGQRAIKLGREICYVPEMVVLHPARRSINELFTKWDRHIDHDFAKQAQDPARALRWGFRALAVAGSPVFEVGRIMSSRRISTWRECGLAAVGLVRIRLYRARRMLKLLLTNSQRGLNKWNRDCHR